MTQTSAVLSVAVMSAVTALLRFLPFLVFSDGKKTPPLVSYLGRVLPCAIMGMLVVYCLKDTVFTAAAGFLPQLIAGALTVLSYLWKKNTLLSILLGTICYMLLVQLAIF